MAQRLIDVNGARLWLADEGAGPPLLLLSGGPGCEDYLAPVAAMLKGTVRTVRVEPRGCGGSSHGGPHDLETTLADLEEVREALGIERWMVGGHSWGADLALAYALEHEARACALLHLCGTGVQNDRDWSAAYHRGALEGRDQTPIPEPSYNPEVHREALASWRRLIKRPDLLRRLSRLDLPTLILCGASDIRPSWPLEQLAALLPRAEFVRLAGAGHVPWLTHAGELAKVMRAFVRRAAPA